MILLPNESLVPQPLMQRMLILTTLVVTKYAEHYLDFAVDCFCQVRQDKRAAKEKRREEARMREVSSIKHFSPQTIGLFLGGEHIASLLFRLLITCCITLFGCFLKFC